MMRSEIQADCGLKADHAQILPGILPHNRHIPETLVRWLPIRAVFFGDESWNSRLFKGQL